MANKEVEDWFGKQIKEKSKGRNHDLSIAEYKVAQETKYLTQLQKQVEESDRAVKANKANEKEYTDKKEKLESDISCLESMRRITRSLSEMDSRESKQISMELDEKRSELQSVNEELASAIEKAEDATILLDRIKNFVSSFRLFAPTIEEYANQVEADKTIEAGNSFRGILNELGKLLEAFKELIKEGLCWFPRLMRWKTSKGEVAPIFLEKSSGYSYSLYGYMNVETKEYYSTNSNKLGDGTSSNEPDNIQNILNAYINRKTEKHFTALVKQEDIENADYNLSVSTYVESEDTREAIDIAVLNKQISVIVQRENTLRAEIDAIIAEIEEA